MEADSPRLMGCKFSLFRKYRDYQNILQEKSIFFPFYQRIYTLYADKTVILYGQK